MDEAEWKGAREQDEKNTEIRVGCFARSELKSQRLEKDQVNGACRLIPPQCTPVSNVVVAPPSPVPSSTPQRLEINNPRVEGAMTEFSRL